MTIHSLNRIFTVSGGSAETEERAIEWRMDWQTGIGAAGTASPQLPSHGRYAFCRGFLNLWTYSDIYDTDTISSVNPPMLLLPARSVLENSEPDNTLPALETSLKDAAVTDKWIRFRPVSNDADNYVQWTATGRRDYYADSPFFQEFFFVEVDTPTLVGDSFSWLRDDAIIITVEDQTIPASASETLNKKAWGRITEYGISVDVLAIGSDEYQTPGEESARLILRYDANLARGKSVTDDLNREWTVKGARAIRERRFLEFDLSRRVQA